MQQRAKLFMNGRSQAVRLPKAFRFPGDEVAIRREGERIILEPVEDAAWPKGFWRRFRKDAEFPVPTPLPGVPVDLG